VKILMPDGSEVPAKLAFKDPDIDLAFIRPEKPESVKLTPVNIADSAPMAVLDDVIIVGRLGKDLNREPVIMTHEIISIISKPRVCAKLGTQVLGMPVFNKDGKFLGIGINRFSAKGDSDSQGPMPTNVVLPAADLIESAAQAK
jgi:S1-C subfamily serine protease